MNKILIASKNLDFIKRIINSINDEKLKVVNLCTNFQEILHNLMYYEIDFLIIDFSLTIVEINDIINLCNEIIKNNPIIFLSSNKNIEIKYSNIYFFNKEIDANFIINYLKYLVKYNSSIKKDDLELENKIKEEMTKMGFEMKNKGDYLIISVIKYIILNKNIGNNLERDIYPIIALNMGIPEKQIKWNINYSINSIYDAKHDIICRYLNIKSFEKPTSKLVISTLLNRL